MDSVFEKEYNLRTLDFDRYNNLKPSSVLDLFQDAAGYHTRQFDHDRFSIEKNNLYWVLVSVRFEFEGKFDPMKPVTVRSWPIKGNGVRYYRNFLLISGDGDVVVKAQSCWAVVDAIKKHIAVNVLTFPEEFVFYEGEPFDEKLSKLADFEAEKALKTLKPSFTDIDYNGHVNNAKYADFILNAINIDKNRKIKSLQIDYQREIKPDDEITIVTKVDGKNQKLKGVDGEGVTRFLAEIFYE